MIFLSDENFIHASGFVFCRCVLSPLVCCREQVCAGMIYRYVLMMFQTHVVVVVVLGSGGGGVIIIFIIIIIIIIIKSLL